MALTSAKAARPAAMAATTASHMAARSAGRRNRRTGSRPAESPWINWSCDVEVMTLILLREHAAQRL